MKRIALLSLVLALIVLAACGGDDKNSPTGIVKHMLSAFEKGDSFNWQQSFCDPRLANLTLLGEQDGIAFSFKNTSYDERDKAGDSAAIAFSATVESDIGGVEVSKDLAWMVDVEKHDGKWCIASITDVDL